MSSAKKVSYGLFSAAVAVASLTGCGGVGRRFESAVHEELSRQHPESSGPLTEAQLGRLPSPVRRYLEVTGAAARGRVHRFRALMGTEMYRKRGAGPMRAPATQFSFIDEPRRLFFMKASMLGLPVSVLHDYRSGHASMQVRVAGLFDAVDLRGGELDAAETVTVLNDLCVFAPSMLVDERLVWEAIDERSAKVVFTNGRHRVAAVLHFNDAGELVNFVSDDRYALLDDGTLRRARWSTPLSSYRDFGGIRLAGRGLAVWHYPEGDFTYGVFEMRDVRYDAEARWIEP